MVLVGCLACATTCVRNPVTGKPELSLVSESEEVKVGKQAAEEALRSIGPYSDRQLESYVSALGQKLAKTTERPNLPWAFHVLDDPAVNAFAMPGGEVFVTRGILAYMTSEAELASVMGHECGHVAAKHSVAMMTRAELAQLGFGVGSILVPDIGRFGGVFGTGLQVLFLKYSRENETQADDLGFRYAFALGYDVRTMKGLFTMLDAVSKKEGGRLPEWLATHPNPENRLEHIEQKIAEVGNVDWDKRVVGREPYLRRIDGLVFGEDARQGYARDSMFIHPQLGFQIAFPNGWKVQNEKSRVISVSGENDAAMELALLDSMSPDQALKQFFSESGAREIPGPGGGPKGPGEARYFQAQTDNGTVGGLVSAFPFANRTFELIAYTSVDRLPAYDSAFRATLSSFGRVSNPRLLDVGVTRIRIAMVPGDMTLKEFQRRFPSVVPIDQLALLNGTKPDQALAPGQLVKRVVASGPSKTSSR
jgi:predicted Zn-dependent protease